MSNALSVHGQHTDIKNLPVLDVITSTGVAYTNLDSLRSRIQDLTVPMAMKVERESVEQALKEWKGKFHNMLAYKAQFDEVIQSLAASQAAAQTYQNNQRIKYRERLEGIGLSSAVANALGLALALWDDKAADCGVQMFSADCELDETADSGEVAKQFFSQVMGFTNQVGPDANMNVATHWHTQVRLQYESIEPQVQKKASDMMTSILTTPRSFHGVSCMPCSHIFKWTPDTMDGACKHKGDPLQKKIIIHALGVNKVVFHFTYFIIII